MIFAFGLIANTTLAMIRQKPGRERRERAAFGGMALVIVRAKKDMPGIIKVRAISDGLVPAEIRVTGR